MVESSEDSDEGTWHPEREESSEEEEEEEEEVDDEVAICFILNYLSVEFPSVFLYINVLNVDFLILRRKLRGDEQ